MFTNLYSSTNYCYSAKATKTRSGCWNSAVFEFWVVAVKALYFCIAFYKMREHAPKAPLSEAWSRSNAVRFQALLKNGVSRTRWVVSKQAAVAAQSIEVQQYGAVTQRLE